MDKKAYGDPESIADTTPTGANVPRNSPQPGRKRRFTGFGVAMLFVLGFALVFYFNVKTVQVSGVSMLPTFKDGRRLLVSKAYWLVGPLQRKDIVVVKDDGPTGYIIKRIAYSAGDQVDWKDQPDSHRLSVGKYVVPKGTVYVLGDNRPQSEDSRKFGPVPLESILGKVIVLQ